MSGRRTDPTKLHVFVQVELDRQIGDLDTDAELLVIHRNALDAIKSKAIEEIEANALIGLVTG